MKKLIIIIVCMITVFIVIMGIKAASICDEYGTYVEGDEKSKTAVYYVFDENGKFASYSQFGMIQQGSYTIKEKYEDFSYVEVVVDEMILQFYIYSGKQCIGYRYDLFIAYKISELPTYINVQGEN